MNILVLGGAGFLGCNLVRRCLDEPHNRVTVVDSIEPRLRSSIENLRDVWSQIRFVRADIRDETAMSEVVKRQDVIFNCAAQTSHPLSMQDPGFDAEINCTGNLRLLEAIRRHNKQAVVVYPSCSTVIGRAPGRVIDENHCERPFDIYSANKGAAEKYYLIYQLAHDLHTVVLRFANLYGPFGKGFPEFGFINYFIHLAWEGKQITVYGKGEQTRNVLFVEDAVEILYRSAFNSDLKGRLLFATHDQHLGVIEIARRIVSVFKRGEVVSVEWPEMRRRIEIDDVKISSAELRRLTSWRPLYSFEEGLEKTKFIMERMDQYEPAGNRSAWAHWVSLHSSNTFKANQSSGPAR